MTRLTCILAVALGVCFITVLPGFAFEKWGSCTSCHGDFTDGTSLKGTVFPSDNKHVMHNSNSYMNTKCALCHTSTGDEPFLGSSGGTSNNPGIGCSGCHEPAGLRAHHTANGVTTCYTAGCHDPEAAPAENVTPTYYGTADTDADNSCNDVLASNTGENWSIGDFIGLDNDGDNLYDLADFDCGPPYQIVSIAIEGNDTRVTWDTVGGRTDLLRSASSVDGTYNDVGSSVTIPGVGLVTTNRLEAGGAGLSPLRVYQVKSDP